MRKVSLWHSQNPSPPSLFSWDSRLVNKPLQTASMSAFSWKNQIKDHRIKDQGPKIKDQFIVGRRKLTLPQSVMAFSVFSIFSYFRFSIREILTESRRLVDEQSIMPINLFNLFDSFWTDPWSLIRWSGDLVILDPVFPGNCMSADNVRCWKIVRKFDNWPRSEASRADVKFWG